MKTILSLLVVTLMWGCQTNAQEKEGQKVYEVTKTEEEWKARLSRMEFEVLRKEATERPFTSKWLSIKQDGVFVCVACQNPLYETKYKYDSGTGWPSFDRAIEGSLDYSSDNKLGYTRTELLCGRCGGHLGHMFNDGPRDTTGQRHCINGVALDFVANQKG